MELAEMQQLIQKEKDREHLNLLSIFYFITTGLYFLGSLFLFLYFSFINSFIIEHDHIHQMSKAIFTGYSNSNKLPMEFYNIFALIFYFIGGLMILNAILNLLTGIYLRQRKHRIFCIIIGALNCLHVPVGTALGAFTIVILSRDSVKNIFDNLNVDTI
jgi:hypothetical protein